MQIYKLKNNCKNNNEGHLSAIFFSTEPSPCVYNCNCNYLWLYKNLYLAILHTIKDSSSWPPVEILRLH